MCLYDDRKILISAPDHPGLNPARGVPRSDVRHLVSTARALAAIYTAISSAQYHLTLTILIRMILNVEKIYVSITILGTFIKVLEPQRIIVNQR